jgi:hypothetical protein
MKSSSSFFGFGFDSAYDLMFLPYFLIIFLASPTCFESPGVFLPAFCFFFKSSPKSAF